MAEFTGSDRGIGFVIIQASYRLDTKRLFAGLVLSSAGGIVFYNRQVPTSSWIRRRNSLIAQKDVRMAQRSGNTGRMIVVRR